MAKLEFFDREIKLATGGIEPEAINAALAKFAREELTKAISAGASPHYDRYVNGRHDAPEEAVRAPGPIVYEFVNWPLVIRLALDELRKRAPRGKGTYAASFVVLANQSPVADYSAIPSTAEVIIFNAQPYTRRIEAGANSSIGKRHFDLASRAVSRRYGDAFDVSTRFVDIKAGVDPRVPYILKGGYARKRAAWLANPAAFGRQRFQRRKDQEAGQPLTYPAIVINTL